MTKYSYRILPDKVVYENLNQNSNNTHECKVSIFPLEKGMGHTVGNSIRRCLLNFIEGFGIIAFKINDLPSEYSTLTGCKEDMIEISQNLKKLKMTHETKYEIIELQVQGPKVVDGLYIANELKKSYRNNINIVDYNQVLLTITTDTVVNISLISAKGYGYFSAEEADYWDEDIKSLLSQVDDFIIIDSVMSPVIRCSYNVMDHYMNDGRLSDKLEIIFATNRTILPERAITKSINCLIEQFITINKIQNADVPEIKKNEFDIQFNPILLELVANIDFASARAQNCLKQKKIEYLGDLVTKTPNELFKTSSLGKVTIQRIKTKLQDLNLELGMYVPDWPIENPKEVRQKYINEINKAIMELNHNSKLLNEKQTQ